MVEEEEAKSESEESSEYEEYTDSEDETGPRLKPVFVPKSDRVTIKEKEELVKGEEQAEVDRKKQIGLRKKESLRVSWIGVGVSVLVGRKTLYITGGWRYNRFEELIFS